MSGPRVITRCPRYHRVTTALRSPSSHRKPGTCAARRPWRATAIPRSARTSRAMIRHEESNACIGRRLGWSDGAEPAPLTSSPTAPGPRHAARLLSAARCIGRRRDTGQRAAECVKSRSCGRLCHRCSGPSATDAYRSVRRLRTTPAIPSKPVASSARLPGSGAETLVMVGNWLILIGSSNEK